MSLSSVFNIAGSAMSAETIRLNLTASNLANADSAGKTPEQTYHAKHSMFTENKTFDNHFDQAMDAAGVKVTGIAQDKRALQQRYQPGHPLANEKGYVYYPNVNVMEEMADMMSASRSYQSNVEVIMATKQMLQAALTLGDIG